MKMLIVGLLAAGVMLGQNPPAKGPTLTPGSNITINGSSSTPCSGPNCTISSTGGGGTIPNTPNLLTGGASNTAGNSTIAPASVSTAITQAGTALQPPGSGTAVVLAGTAGSPATTGLNGSAVSHSLVNDYAAPTNGTSDATTAFTNAGASGLPIYVPCTAGHSSNQDYVVTAPIQIFSNTQLWSDCNPVINANVPSSGTAYLRTAFYGYGTYPDAPGTIVLTDTYPSLISLNSGTQGATTVTCTVTGCASNVTAGSWICIAEGASPKWDTFRQYVQVASVDGTNSIVTLNQPTEWTLGVTSTNLGFFRIAPIQNVRISGLTIKGNTALNGYYGIILGLAIDPIIDHNHFLTLMYYPFAVYDSKGTQSLFNVAEYGMTAGAQYSTDVLEQGNIYMNIGPTASEYGQGAHNIEVKDNIYKHWNGAGGLIGTNASRNIKFDGNIFDSDYNTAANFLFYHSYGDNISFIGNQFLGVSGPTMAICQNTPSLTAAIACRNLQVQNNNFVTTSGNTNPAIFAANSSSAANSIYSGNSFSGYANDPISVTGGATNANMAGWIINNNTLTSVVAPVPGGFTTSITSGSQPAAVATNGTNGQGLTITNPKGGNTTGTSGQTGGIGGTTTITSGDGGNAPSGSTNGFGGNIIIQTGAAGSGAGGAPGGAYGSLLLQKNGGCVGIAQSSCNTSFPLDVIGNMRATQLLNANSTFFVDSTGNIDTLRGVSVSFPSANAVGPLTNNGSGIFSYPTVATVSNQTSTIGSTVLTSTAGLYLVSIYTSSNSTVCTNAVGLGWTDKNGAQTSIPVAATAVAGNASQVVNLVSGNLTYSLTIAGSCVGGTGFDTQIVAQRI